ncbi:hypothetical protein [Marilutibacter chinensis]|uniref:Uncharacterized protein n=1 Tax=Marilutibacter chinensis TaxID=2912247 RepID=A0ABS9HTA8_9GAMM|nr:hypothetical protein [Lysobacter chinensis]MCF7221387.1 hypothetical protein [Lysobacter chinensis]
MHRRLNPSRRSGSQALLASLAFLLASASASAGRPYHPPHSHRVAHPVQMTLVDRDSGDWLPVHRHHGEQWVAGTPGHRYAVRLSNTSDRRVLVVLSVDGVNAVSGETADPSQAGYVLEPWQSTEIGGWRKSLDDVARFVFTDPHHSYASRTGRPRNVGVIGIAVFEEAWRARPYPQTPEIARSEASQASGQTSDRAAEAAASPSAAETRALGHAGRQRLGTGHGAREWSPASRTRFVRASAHPTQISEIRYDTRARLAARGIVPRWHRHRDDIAAPRAFPDGFVPDPPGY